MYDMTRYESGTPAFTFISILEQLTHICSQRSHLPLRQVVLLYLLVTVLRGCWCQCPVCVQRSWRTGGGTAELWLRVQHLATNIRHLQPAVRGGSQAVPEKGQFIFVCWLGCLCTWERELMWVCAVSISAASLWPKPEWWNGRSLCQSDLKLCLMMTSIQFVCAFLPVLMTFVLFWGHGDTGKTKQITVSVLSFDLIELELCKVVTCMDNTLQKMLFMTGMHLEGTIDACFGYRKALMLVFLRYCASETFL